MCQALTATPADRIFKRRCQVTASVAFLLYVTCSQASLRMPSGLLPTVLAAISGAAFFAEIVAVAFLLVRIRDEFQRILLTRSFLWATAVTMALATVWGFIELHAHETVPHLPVLVIPVALVFFTAFAKVLIFRRYRSPNE